jgi:predicted nucleic acid-binding protein
VILLDTSVVVDGLTGSRQSLPLLIRAAGIGEPLVLCTEVVYEWLRGPRDDRDLRVQQALFPIEMALPFETADAEIAARLYRSVRRARGREADIAIAACAIRHDAQLWTLNEEDFRDIPGLRLYRPTA